MAPMMLVIIQMETPSDEMLMELSQTIASLSLSMRMEEGDASPEVRQQGTCYDRQKESM